MKKALVLGGAGFIGHHLVQALKKDGWWVKAADILMPEFSSSLADEFVQGDLREHSFCDTTMKGCFDRVYQLAADMGGAGYVFTGDNDAAIMMNSTQINLNVLNAAKKNKPGMLFFASSACIYPEPGPENTDMYNENSAYPANADSEYGWEKLYSERLYLSHARNYGLQVRIARLHNVFGPEGAWKGGREKAIAAICRKVALADNGGEIEIWGDGRQTRSFLFIGECLEGMEKLMQSSFAQPLNLGSSEMVSITELAEMIIQLSGKKLSIKYCKGPTGVSVRTSNNRLIARALGWEPVYPLSEGLRITYKWIVEQVEATNPGNKP